MFKFKKFPQITRRIPAWFVKGFFNPLRFLSIAIIAVMTYLNFYTQLFPENEEYVNLRLEMLKKINDPSPIVKLAIYFKKHGLKKEAEENFKLAQNLSLRDGEKNVLGEEDFSFVYQQLKQEERQIFEELSYWQKIIEEKPDFRDAYFEVGKSFYKIGEHSAGKQFILKALEIDPFYPEKKRYLNLII